ncbi:precorrin-6B methylase 1 [Cenarchaeum symbiosum A]|uniref:Precorrin-6B methylase 1 n=1 Tax=Cenarchaeum symbiosum (strain A) TaxID=414004 RepID=A0RYN5_CENSY|nr:precorrin-6B methylase 1 [Cenarchaeum symbiosum A]
MKAKVYAVGVGPGSPACLTGEAREAINACGVVAGHEYTLHAIAGLLEGKEVHRITMATQEEVYQRIAAGLGERSLAVPFTGDASFSESEVVDRLVEIFGDVRVVPGISAIQVAAARARIPLDKSRVITMHVTPSIEGKKLELQKALLDGLSVILVPRPWPRSPERHFMPSEIAAYLRGSGFDTGRMRVCVFERLTGEDEASFEGMVSNLEGKEFSDLSVMVFDQHRPDSYMNYQWQWNV